MRRFTRSLLVLALLASPRLALAHDPLDDVSGEEDLNNTNKSDDPPRSQRKERQQQELNREVQEREEAEFHVNQEKDEFLRDRAETRDVIEAQRRRNQLSGGPARPHRDEPEVKPLAPARRDDDDARPARSNADTDVEVKPARGDVDPTDPTAVEASPEVEGSPDNAPPPPSKKKKKKHADE